MGRLLRAWAPFLAAAALLAVATLTPRPPEVPLPRIPHLDKLVHAAAWAVLGALARRGAGRGGLAPARAAWVAWAVAVGYGGLIEALQGLVPNRSAEALDLLADAAGAALGVALAGRGGGTPWRRRRASSPGPRGGPP